MTDERLDFWIAYFVTLRNALKLSEWRIILEDKIPDNPDCGAAVQTLYGRRVASVRLCYGWDDLGPERQRLYATHELLHLYFTPIQSVMDRAKECFGDQAELAASYHMEQMEYAIDGLAEAVAPRLPLPPDVAVARGNRMMDNGKPESIRRLQLGAAQLRYASRMVLNDKDFRAARRVLLLLILNYRKIEPWPRQG